MTTTFVRRMARVSALAVASVLTAVTLTSCTAAEECAPTIATDGVASVVTATGALGTMPTLDFPQPVVAEAPSLHTLTAGTGDTVRFGDYVDFEAVAVFGADGSPMTSTAYYADQHERLSISAEGSLVAQSFHCQTVGSRVVLVGSVLDIFGDLSANGLDNDATVVVALDVLARYSHKAEGAAQPAQDGMPAVVSAPNGEPGITLPKTAAPTELRVSTLIQGEGDVVAEGDTIVAHYTGLLWDTGIVFDSSWDRDKPANLVAQDFTTHDGAGVVPGFAQAVVGQTVGSRVLVVIPPALGYPEGSSPQSIPFGSTMVFVVDILGIG